MTDDATLRPEVVLQGLARFVERVVVPLEERHAAVLSDPRTAYDEHGAVSPRVRELIREVRTSSANAGFYAMFAPAEIGGGGLGPSTNYLTWEFLHRHYGPARDLPYETVAHWATGPSFLCRLVAEPLRQRIAAELVAGTASACFAMSEPDAGSDAWGMRTRAVRDGAGWIINGSKQWITNGPLADYAFVFAVTDAGRASTRSGGISCFIVPTATPGFEVTSVIKLFGRIGGHEAILSFTDMRVGPEQLVGELDQGLDVALEAVAMGRVYNAARCIGLAQWALERAVDYSRKRTTFGHPIADYQAVSFPLADSAMEIYGCRSMALDCVAKLERGESAHVEVAMVKASATEMCVRVYDRCMQVHGGMGLANDTRLYDGWHQARTVRIADGTGEILRRTIARALLKGSYRA